MQTNAITTIRDFNEAARRFWEKESALMERRMGDETIREIALEKLADDYRRLVPIYNQKSLEKALEEAEAEIERHVKIAKKRVLSEQGRKGGTAKKADVLQDLIVQLVRKNPQISCAQLLEKLEAPYGPPIIEIADGKIFFQTSDNPDDAPMKKATISGLKDRLSRAKKVIRENR